MKQYQITKISLLFQDKHAKIDWSYDFTIFYKDF